MDRTPIDARVEADAGRPDESGGRPGVSKARFREALAEWASTVTVVSVRDGRDVHGVTVTSFAPVSADPPLIVVSLGASAKVVPFLPVEGRFVVSLLAEGQDRIATVLADTFPVGPSPFPGEGDPVVEGCIVALVCTVERIAEAGGGRLVVGRVQEVRSEGGARPLLYQRRGYRTLAHPDPEGS